MKRALPYAVALAVMLALAEEAEARVGGGQTFNTGGGRSSGGSGGGSIEGELIYLLIRLCFYYPQIGVPVLFGVVGFYAWQNMGESKDRARVVMEAHDQPAHSTVAQPMSRPNRRERRRRSQPQRSGWQDLSARDPGLSQPVLIDFMQLVYRRSWAAGSKADREALAPFVGDDLWATMDALRGEAARIDEVVVGGMAIDSVAVTRSWTLARIRVSASRREHDRKGGSQHIYAEEIWTFRRAADAHSLPPDETRRLACPSCGAAVQCDAMGRCTNCETPITEGQLQWQAVELTSLTRRRLTAPAVSLTSGAEDPSYQMSSRSPHDLPARVRAFSGRHPDFERSAFDARVAHVFNSLQTAWSAGRWQDARPFVTDSAWNTLRFWLDRYAEEGQHNRLADIDLHRVELVDAQLDAWYDTLTVRVFASMRDWVEDGRGKVVGGNKKHSRRFSEYWTFIRAVGSGDTSADPHNCPSCGAPLDNVSATGVCGYCESVITTGSFDWVLSRIDQAEVYQPLQG